MSSSRLKILAFFLARTNLSWCKVHIFIHKKTNHKTTYRKLKDTYWFSVLNSKDQVSFADGLRNIGTMKYTSESSGAYADGDGNVSVEHSKEEGSVDVGALGDSIDAVGSLFGNKDAKKKKKLQADSRPVVVIKIK